MLYVSRRGNEVALRKPLTNLNDARCGDNQLLGLSWKIEEFEVNRVRIFSSQRSQISRDIELIDVLLIGRWLLTDIPFQIGQRQVLSTLRDGRFQPRGGIAAIGTEGHVVLANVIEDSDQFDWLSLRLQLIDRLPDEVDEAGVQIEILGAAALWSPIVDLRATMRELGDSDVTDVSLLQRISET